MISKVFRQPQRVVIPFYQDEFLKMRVEVDGLDVLVNGGPLDTRESKPAIANIGSAPLPKLQPKADVQSPPFPTPKVIAHPIASPKPTAIFKPVASDTMPSVDVPKIGIQSFGSNSQAGLVPTLLTRSISRRSSDMHAPEPQGSTMDTSIAEVSQKIPSRQASTCGSESEPAKPAFPQLTESVEVVAPDEEKSRIIEESTKESPPLPSKQASQPETVALDLEKARKALEEELAALKKSIESDLLNETLDWVLSAMIPSHVKEAFDEYTAIQRRLEDIADNRLGHRYFRKWIKEMRRNTASKMHVDRQLTFTYEVPPAPSSFAARWKHLLAPNTQPESSPWEGLSGSVIDFASILSVPALKSHLLDQDLYWKVIVVSSFEGKLPESIFNHIASPSDAISVNSRVSTVNIQPIPRKLHLSSVLWQDGHPSQLMGANAVIFVISKASSQDEDRKWFSLLMSNLNPSVPITLFILSCVRGYDDVSVSLHLNLEAHDTACISHCFIWASMTDDVPSAALFSQTVDQHVQQMLFHHILSLATVLSPPVNLSTVVEYELNRHLEGVGESSSSAIVLAINSAIHSVIHAMERSVLTHVWPPKELFDAESNCAIAASSLRQCLLQQITPGRNDVRGQVQRCIEFSLAVTEKLAIRTANNDLAQYITLTFAHDPSTAWLHVACVFINMIVHYLVSVHPCLTVAFHAHHLDALQLHQAESSTALDRKRKPEDHPTAEPKLARYEPPAVPAIPVNHEPSVLFSSILAAQPAYESELRAFQSQCLQEKREQDRFDQQLHEWLESQPHTEIEVTLTPSPSVLPESATADELLEVYHTISASYMLTHAAIQITSRPRARPSTAFCRPTYQPALIA